ncbi:MAG: autotransporter domain-containing protein [Parvibaculaceae bacterium]
MRQPLNWIIAGGGAKRVSKRALRNRLAATTILAVAPFLGYGRQAYADCISSVSPTFVCSGPSAGEVILGVANADVSTSGSPAFVVTTEGVSIAGDGNIRFIDENANTSISNTTYGDTGLRVRSLGDDGDTPGAVTIVTDGAISGSGHGIDAYNGGSGDISITVNGTVTGTDVDESEYDDDIPNDGIHAENSEDGDDITITTGTGSAVSGEHNGIDARNYGSGDLTITTGGDVTGNEFDAIFAINNGNDLSVTVEARSVVDGAGNGIGAYNNGIGALDIDVYGQVTSRGYDGIRAYNHGTTLDITTGAASHVYGDDNGIDARNYGEDALTISVGGYVTGFYNDGIHARNYGTDLSITTDPGSVVRGGGDGIGAMNYGSGDLTIEANGWVGGYAYGEGGAGDGIRAYNSEDGGALTITTGAGSTIRGYDDGIQADNEGRGALTITVEGTVTGRYADGISAHNQYGATYNEDTEDYTALTITTGAASKVTGDYDGIAAFNRGEGTFTITVDGDVSGRRGAGIYAESDGGDMTIATGADSDVFGGKDGIDAINFGYGALRIDVRGRVTGEGLACGEEDYYCEDGDGGDGIYAYNFGGRLTIVTGAGSAVTGGLSDGIDAVQRGEGDLSITVNGSATGQGEYGSGVNAFNAGYIYGTLDAPEESDLPDPNPDEAETIITVGAGGVAQGNYAGIRAGSSDGQKIWITNDGLVRNLSGSSDRLAIVTWGAATNIDNNADLIGAVTTDLSDVNSFDDTVNNRGFWNFAGTDSDLGAGSEDTVNNSGVLVAADDSAEIETTRILRVENFDNEGGLISLIDGQAGDEFAITDQPEGSADPSAVNFTGSGSLAVDAALGAPGVGVADEFHIFGSTQDGYTTTVHVNVVSAAGANFEGIPVVVIEGDAATSDAAHVILDGPVSGGFFMWDMRYDEANKQHELFTLNSGTEEEPGDPVLGAGAQEFPAGFAATKDIWLQTLGTALHRQADLRSLLQNLSVTPAADYAEPVEPTPIGPTAIVSPGFWYKGFGAYVERDSEAGGFDISNRQTTYGGMAGFDFGTREAVGDALLFGVFGGYIVSDLKFEATDSKWKYEGPTVGAYVTYLDQAFYADLTVKADFLDIDIDPDDLAVAADDSDSDAVNVGGRLDTGYKFGRTVFVEPQASLAVVHSEVDDVDIFGGTVEFDDQTSVLGRLGLRLGVDHTAADATVYSADVTASVWEDFTSGNDATISVPGLTDIGVSDDPASTYGDVALGLSVANPDGWSSFLRANYLFADDYEAVTGNAGVRFVW